MKKDLTELIKNQVFEILSKWDSNEARRHYRYGASLSHLKILLRYQGWTHISNIHDFEDLLIALGFSTAPALLENGAEHKWNRCVIINEKGGDRI